LPQAKSKQRAITIPICQICLPIDNDVAGRARENERRRVREEERVRKSERLQLSITDTLGLVHIKGL